MWEINRSALFGKLSELPYKAIESATVFCKMRGNPYVELGHWLHQILNQPDSDLHRIVRHFHLDAGKLARDLTESLDRLPRGATSVSDLSVHVEESVERGWVYASLLFEESRVRTGHLLVGMLKTKTLANALYAISREFQKVKIDELTEKFASITDGSPEPRLSSPTPGAASSSGGEVAPAALGKQEALAALLGRPHRARAQRRDGPHRGARRRDKADHPRLATPPPK